MLAVDLPLVGPELLKYVIRRARQSNATVTVPRTDEGLQPLCAVYRCAFAEVAEQSLRDGNNKIDLLFRKVEICMVEEDELAKAGFSVEIFRNLNTPEDLDQAKGLRFPGSS